jgi:RHS repeat-associated protein
MYEAARVGDGISHSSALSGFLIGAVIGIALIAAVAFATFTCGFGVALLAGLAAGIGATGILGLAEAIGRSLRSPTGKILTGSRDVFTNGRPAAQVKGSGVICDRHPPIPRVAEGSTNVFINGLPAARIDDRIECDAQIAAGSSNVFIGGGRKPYLKITPEIPAMLRTGVDVAFMLAGLVGGLAGVIRKAGDAGIRAMLPCAAKFIVGFGIGEAVGRYVISPAIGGLIGHPVEVTTGRKLLLPQDETDFSLIGRLPITCSRYYGSDLSEEGMLGKGWRHEWEITLRIDGEQVIYTGVQGRDVPFPHIAAGQKIHSEAEQLTLAHLQDGRYVVHGLDQIYYQFGAPGIDGIAHLTRIEDMLGQRLMFERDDDGRLAAIAGPGQRVRLHYEHPLQRLTGVELLDGGTPGMLVRYGYDEAGQLASVTDRQGHVVRRFAYRDGLMVEQANALGLTCCYRWETVEGIPRVVEHTSSLGERYRFSYDPGQRHSQVEDSFGRKAHWRYDERHQITENTWFDGSRTRFEYDAHGNPHTLHLSGQRLVRFEYDHLGRLIKETDPLGRVTQTVYHADSLRVQHRIFADGSKWSAHYDARGLLLSTQDPLDRATRYEYGADGLLETVTDARGGIKRMQWNERGRITAYTDCSGKTTRYEYDRDGYLNRVVDAVGQRTQIERQISGEPILILRADGTQEQFEYGPAGLPQQHRDAAGNTRRWEYNAAGQVLSAIGAGERAVCYQYDAHGRLTRLTNPNGAAYRFDYDDGDRLRLEVGVDGIAKRYRYDEAGHMVAVDTVGRDDSGHPQQRSVHLARDAAGRLTARHTDTAVTTYEYDALDRLLCVTRTPTDAGQALGIAADMVRFDYDAAGQLIAEHGTGGSLAYELDELGNLTRLTLPQGQVLDLLSYGSGHVHQMRIGDKLICDIERDDLHREILRTQGRLSTAFGYDAMGRRSWQSTAVPDFAADAASKPPVPGQGKLWRSYAYNPAEELFEQRDALRGQTHYQYDSDGRLLSRAARDNTEHFAWDNADNLQAHGSHGRLDNNRLTVWQDLRYEYDAFGNVRAKKKGRMREQRFIYDADDRLIEVRGNAGSGDCITRFAYDALGRRIGKTVQPAVDVTGTGKRETRFVWQGLRLRQEIDSEYVRSYMYEEEQGYTPLARLDQQIKPDGTLSKGALYYFHTDQIGTPLEVTAEDGRLMWAGEYGAWGKVERQVLDAPVELVDFTQNLRFAGQYADDGTGLYYNTFRYYDPDIGRFATQDPIGLDGGINLYQYAPNPVRWIDPLGLHEILADTDLVCRGGTCTAEQFRTGSGVTADANGKLHGVSTQARQGAKLETLAQPFRNGQVGVATVKDIERAGGKITLDGKLNSVNGTHMANHATVDGLTAEQAEKLFNPAKQNPVPKAERGC